MLIYMLINTVEPSEYQPLLIHTQAPGHILAAASFVQYTYCKAYLLGKNSSKANSGPRLDV